MLSTVGIIIDVVIVAVLVIFSLIGLKKGFLKSVLSLFSWGICIVIAFLTAKYVAGWINGIYDFSELIGGKIATNLSKTNEFFSQSINVYESGGKAALISASNALNINSLLKQVIKIIFSNTNVNMSSTATIGSVVGSSIGDIVMIVIAGILVFIILKIAISLLMKLFKKIEDTKILGGLNKILGLCFGLVKATLIILVINLALVGLSLVPPINRLLTPLIQDNTYVEKVIYNSTDKLFEKYVVEGDVVETIVENLWEKR